MNKADMLKIIDSPINEAKAYELIKLFYTGQNASFYENLTYGQQKYIESTDYSKDFNEKQNKLLLKVYNTWRKNMLSLSEAKISELEADIPDIKERIKNIQDLPVFDDIRKFENYLINNNYLKNIGCPIMKNSSKFREISGTEMSGYNNIAPKTQVRLYLSPNNENTVDLVGEIIRKTLQRGTSFRLKFTSNTERADQIVLYTDYNYVMEYKSIIEEIRNENPALFNDYKNLNSIWGNLNNYIGIGDEPEEIGTSYSENRSDMLIEAIKNATNILIKRALTENREVDDNGIKVSFEEKLSMSVKDVKDYIYKKLSVKAKVNVEEFLKRPDIQDISKLVDDYTDKIFNDYRLGKDPVRETIFYNMLEFNEDAVKLVQEKVAPALYKQLYNKEFYDIFMDQGNQLSDKYRVFPENITFNKDIEDQLTPDEKYKIYAERYLTGERAKGISNDITKEKILNTLKQTLQGNKVVKKFKGPAEWAESIGKVVGEENGLTVEYTQNEKGETLVKVSEKVKNISIQSKEEIDCWAETPEETQARLEAARRNEEEEKNRQVRFEELIQSIKEIGKKADIPDHPSDPTNPSGDAGNGLGLQQEQKSIGYLEEQIITGQIPLDQLQSEAMKRFAEKNDRLNSIFADWLEGKGPNRRTSASEAKVEDVVHGLSKIKSNVEHHRLLIEEEKKKQKSQEYGMGY